MTEITPKRWVAIAGSTGYTGREIVAQLENHPRWRARALMRPAAQARSPFPATQDQVACEMHDVGALTTALRGCSAVIQTIGTTQARFAPGVSYETVDFGTTIALLTAAEAAGVPRFLLLSSAGAGIPLGAYLRWKARTETIVRESPLQWTILRPSAIVGPERRLMQAALFPLTPLSHIPIVGGLAPWLRAIEVHDLARCFINCLHDRTTIHRTLEGPALWARV